MTLPGKVKLPCQAALAGSLRTRTEHKYIAMFDSRATATLERIKDNLTREITDDDFTVMLCTGDVVEEGTAKIKNFSTKLHYL